MGISPPHPVLHAVGAMRSNVENEELWPLLRRSDLPNEVVEGLWEAFFGHPARLDRKGHRSGWSVVRPVWLNSLSRKD